MERAERDARFRQHLLIEAINQLLTGDLAAGKAMLRDYINATISFDQLARKLKKPSKSLHRMLGPLHDRRPKCSCHHLGLSTAWLAPLGGLGDQLDPHPRLLHHQPFASRRRNTKEKVNAGEALIPQALQPANRGLFEIERARQFRLGHPGQFPRLLDGAGNGDPESGTSQFGPKFRVALLPCLDRLVQGGDTEPAVREPSPSSFRSPFQHFGHPPTGGLDLPRRRLLSLLLVGVQPAISLFHLMTAFASFTVVFWRIHGSAGGGQVLH